MLQLQGVSLQLGDQLLLDRVDLRLGPKERVALVGRNGAGKSTLMKAAVGMIPHDGGAVSLGRGESAGYLRQEHLVSGDRSLWDEVHAVLEPILNLERRASELFAEAGDIEGDEPARERLLEEASELLERFQVGGGFEAEARCGRVLSGLGFSREDWKKKASDFSGGKQVTIGLARLLLERPRYLLLDEPTNHLDIETRTWLLHELRDYPGGILLVSHDKDFLDRLVTRTIEIARGGLTSWSGGYSSFLRQRAERLVHLRARAESLAAERTKMEAFIRRFRYKATKAAQVQSRIKMLEKMEVIELPEEEKRVRLRFPDPPPAPSPMFQLQGVSKSYGELRVLDDIHLSVYPGERVLLVGTNGAGKSTLLKLICGKENADGGGFSLLSGTRQAWFAQDQARELPEDSTIMDVTSAMDRSLPPARVRALLGALLFRGDDVHKRCAVLSGGEKSRVALGRVLLEKANLLLLDEPTNHLDIESKDILADALEHFTGTIIFVSHDREFANRLATTVWEVGNRAVHSHRGNLDDFLWKKAIEAGIAKSRAPGEPAPDAWLLGGLPEDKPRPSPTATKSGSEEEDRRPTQVSDEGISWNERKRLASLRKRQQRQADQLMIAIEELETRMAGLEEKMAEPSNATHWDKLEGWSRERTALDRKRVAAYEEWERLEALLKT